MRGDVYQANGVIRLRAYLLLIKLPYGPEHLEKEIGTLAAKLPRGSKRVLYVDRVIGFLMPHETIAEITKVRLGPMMQDFSDWWIIGLDGQLVSKNGSMDPFRHWMNELGGGGIKTSLKPRNPENVENPKRRQPRGERAVSDFVDGAAREMILKPPSEGDGA